MATKKPPFTFHIEEKRLEKLRYIADKCTRSISNLLEHLCKLHIEEYEQSYGKIEIPPEPKNQ